MKKLQKTLSTLFALSVLFTTSPTLAKNQETVSPEMVNQTADTQMGIVLADKVNINTASAEELQHALKGIGEKKAQAIVAYREQHGHFISIEQLTEVKGIGKAIVEKNKDRIRL